VCLGKSSAARIADTTTQAGSGNRAIDCPAPLGAQIMIGPSGIESGARFERTRTSDRSSDGGRTWAASPSNPYRVADATERAYANSTTLEHASHPEFVGTGTIPQRFEGTGFPRRKLAGWALYMSVTSPFTLRYHLPVAERLTQAGERELDNRPVGRGRLRSF